MADRPDRVCRCRCPAGRSRRCGRGARRRAWPRLQTVLTLVAYTGDEPLVAQRSTKEGLRRVVLPSRTSADRNERWSGLLVRCVRGRGRQTLGLIDRGSSIGPGSDLSSAVGPGAALEPSSCAVLARAGELERLMRCCSTSRITYRRRTAIHLTAGKVASRMGRERDWPGLRPVSGQGVRARAGRGPPVRARRDGGRLGLPQSEASSDGSRAATWLSSTRSSRSCAKRASPSDAAHSSSVVETAPRMMGTSARPRSVSAIRR